MVDRWGGLGCRGTHWLAGRPEIARRGRGAMSRARRNACAKLDASSKLGPEAMSCISTCEMQTTRMSVFGSSTTSTWGLQQQPLLLSLRFPDDVLDPRRVATFIARHCNVGANTTHLEVHRKKHLYKARDDAHRDRAH